MNNRKNRVSRNIITTTPDLQCPCVALDDALLEQGALVWTDKHKLQMAGIFQRWSAQLSALAGQAPVDGAHSQRRKRMPRSHTFQFATTWEEELRALAKVTKTDWRMVFDWAVHAALHDLLGLAGLKIGEVGTLNRKQIAGVWQRCLDLEKLQYYGGTLTHKN